MKVGVSKKNCKFYVDKDARVVVCVIPNTRGRFLDFIGSSIVNENFDLPYPKQYRDYHLPSSIVAKAKCAPEDEWDEEYGRELAYQRAKEKFYRYFFRYADKYVKYLVDQVYKCAEVFDNIQKCLDEKVKIDESEDNDQ